MEVRTVLSSSLLQQHLAKQTVDLPALRSGVRRLQGFFPEQNSTALPVQQIVDIPVCSGGLQGFRPGQISTVSSSSPGAADEAFERVFRTSPQGKKVRGSRGQVSAQLGGHVISSMLSTHQMGWTELPDEESEEEDPNRWVDEYRRIWRKTATLFRRWWLLGTDIFWDEPGLAAAGAGPGEEAAGVSWWSSWCSLRTRFCSVLWSRSSLTFLGWTGFNSALRGAEPWDVGLVVPFSDEIVFRTASLGTWTLFPRARFCDTLPTCFATVHGDIRKNFLRISIEGGHGS